MTPSHPKKLKKHYCLDEIDREIAAMTPEERLAAIRTMAGTWGHLEESEQGWGFQDLSDLYDQLDQVK